MTNSFQPDKYQYVEKRAMRDRKTTQVQLEVSEYLDRFIGRISFLTFTIFPVKPSEHVGRMRVCTYSKKIPMNIVQQCLVTSLNCEVVPVNPYSITHSFDVTVPVPITLADFALKIVKALEGQI